MKVLIFKDFVVCNIIKWYVAYGFRGWQNLYSPVQIWVTPPIENPPQLCGGFINVFKYLKVLFENDLLHLEIPKLIFEVLSDSNEKNDRECKMELYARAGIQEYLLVDYRNFFTLFTCELKIIM